MLTVKTVWLNKRKTIVLYGVEDTLVVETDDIILVSNRHRSQDIRKVTEILKAKESLGSALI